MIRTRCERICAAIAIPVIGFMLLWAFVQITPLKGQESFKPPILSAEDRAALEIAKRDAIIANRDRQLAERQVEDAKRHEQQAIRNFQMKVEGARARLKAPADLWDFDVDRLAFTQKPLPKPAAHADADGDAGKYKPQAAEADHQ